MKYFCHLSVLFSRLFYKQQRSIAYKAYIFTNMNCTPLSAIPSLAALSVSHCSGIFLAITLLVELGQLIQLLDSSNSLFLSALISSRKPSIPLSLTILRTYIPFALFNPSLPLTHLSHSLVLLPILFLLFSPSTILIPTL